MRVAFSILGKVATGCCCGVSLRFPETRRGPERGESLQVRPLSTPAHLLDHLPQQLLCICAHFPVGGRVCATLCSGPQKHACCPVCSQCTPPPTLCSGSAMLPRLGWPWGPLGSPGPPACPPHCLPPSKRQRGAWMGRHFRATPHSASPHLVPFTGAPSSQTEHDSSAPRLWHTATPMHASLLSHHAGCCVRPKPCFLDGFPGPSWEEQS